MGDTDAARGERDHAERLSGALLRALLIAGGIFALAWMASMVSLVLLLAFAAVVIAIALNEPVAWLEQRGVPRLAGTFGVLIAITLVAVAVGLVVGSKLVEQAAALASDAPSYLEAIEEQSDKLFDGNASLDRAFEPVNPDSTTRSVLPAVGDIASRVGRFSLGVAALIVLGITWLTIVVYLVLNPRPMLRGMLRLAPVAEREAVERAYATFSQMVMGWLWANVFVGVTEAVLVAAFLSWMDVPAAFVWALLASVAVFIPKIGAWIMALPPFLVMLAIDPSQAVWIVVFYVVMNEIMSDVVLPRIQGHGMDVHPAYLVVFVLAFGSAFGLLGAVVATPFAGLVAAVWDEFVLSRRPPVEHEEERIEQLLRVGVDPPARSA